MPGRLILDSGNLLGEKPETMSCGLACTELLLRHLQGCGLKNADAFEVFWTTDIGTLLVKEGISICISVHESKLLQPFNDIASNDFPTVLSVFLERPLPAVLRQGYESILRFLSEGGMIEKKLVSSEDIEQSLAHNLPVILCVESRTFHGDPSLAEGHFVIVAGCDDYTFGVISPSRESFSVCFVEKAHLLHACHLWGGWAVFVKQATLT